MMGLNESYAGMRGQVLMLDPLPSVAKVFNLVVQEEIQRAIGSGQLPSSESMAFNISQPSSFIVVASIQNKPKRDRLICSHCGAMVHTVDRCYKLHGYPLGYKSKSKSQSSAQPNFPQSINMMKPQSEQSRTFLSFHLTATTVAPQAYSSSLSTDQVQQLIAYLSSQLQQQALDTLDSQPTNPSVSHIFAVDMFSDHVLPKSIPSLSEFPSSQSQLSYSSSTNTEHSPSYTVTPYSSRPT
ncbi:hypothetical protein F0562_001169 [Nyssa sinensis]|uniref:Uncharacterized protein n=1 Tax=Nyssa sinensis TaxID=561372 RepID=A0A5J5C254_9ASTE|nr:hypothetical protein F0562_001169 [Nyssa sinensis]